MPLDRRSAGTARHPSEPHDPGGCGAGDAGRAHLLPDPRAAQKRLDQTIIAVSSEYVRNVLVPDGMGAFMHVDYLMLTSRGVLVIDLRDVRGNIFGGDQMTEWTVMNGANRTTFVNPQHAIYDRVAAVRSLAGDLPVEGRVLFTRR